MLVSYSAHTRVAFIAINTVVAKSLIYITSLLRLSPSLLPPSLSDYLRPYLSHSLRLPPAPLLPPAAYSFNQTLLTCTAPCYVQL